MIVFGFVDPCDLIFLAEVEESDELLSLIVAADAEDVVIVGLDDPCVGLIVKDLVLGADDLEDAQGVKDSAFACGEVISESDFIPVEIAAVQITAVVPFQRIFVVGIVVFLADLITAVEHGNAALGEEEGVQHDIQADGAVKLVFVIFVLGSLDAAQGCGCAAQTGVTQTGIVIVKLAAGIAVIALAGQVVVEVFLVGDFFHSELFEEVVIQAPADIVVAAQVVQEGVVMRQREDSFHLMTEQAHIVSSHGMPGAGHGRDVVEHVAFGLLDRSEIRHDLGGLHDDFAQKQGAGADDLGGHAHQADQRVDLRQVAAVGAQFFPDIGRCIQTDDIDTVVAQVQHVSGHIVEDDRICVVQIPLIRIESGHDDLAGLFAPGEVSGRGLREYLGDGLLKFAGNRPVIVEEVSVLIFLLTGAGTLCPLVVFAGVVHDEVQADTHAALVALIAELSQIFHRAEGGLYFAEIRDRVTAVGPSGRALQQRHKVDVVESALLQIIQMRLDTLESTSEAVGIHEHSQHLVALIPLRHFLTHLVPLLQSC